MSGSGSSSGMSGSGNRTGVTVEQVIGEAFIRTAQTILTSRIHVPGHPSANQKCSTWFKLELAELESANPELDRWRKDPGLPLILEIYLQPWASPSNNNNDTTNAALLERWVVHYKPSLPDPAIAASGLTRSQLNKLSPQSVYKRLTIMLRSLYSYVRILPAYRLYRACQRAPPSSPASFSTAYKIHSTLPRRATAAVSLPGAATGTRNRMQHFDFSPIDTAYGQLRLSVDYQPSSTVHVLEQTTAPLALPQLISDYVGGPRQQLQRRVEEKEQQEKSAAAAAYRLPLRSVASEVPSFSSPVSIGPPPAAGAIAAPALGTPKRQSWSSGAMWSRLQSAKTTTPSSSGDVTPIHFPANSGGRGMQETPFGSAPAQQGIMTTPRSLSTPTGKPPLPPSPRNVNNAPEEDLTVNSTSTSSIPPKPSSLGPGSTAASVPRQISAPVSIPGSGDITYYDPSSSTDTRQRRLRSSGDLAALQAAARNIRPLSAPATSHMKLPNQQPTQKPPEESPCEVGNGSESVGVSAESSSCQLFLDRTTSSMNEAYIDTAARLAPLEPLPPITGTSLSASSSLTSSAAFPASCSPDLPFAFTPTAAGGGREGSASTSFGLNLRRLSSFGSSSTYAGDSGSGALDSPGRGFSMSVSPAKTPISSTTPSRGTKNTNPRAATATSIEPPQTPSSGAFIEHGSASGDGQRHLGATTISSLLSETSPSSLPQSSSSRALVRRPSMGSASMRIGYSVSPIQDTTGIDSILSTSTPKQMFFQGRLASLPTTAAGHHHSLGGGGITSKDSSSREVHELAPHYGQHQHHPRLLTFPTTAVETIGDSAAGGGATQHAEGDFLSGKNDGRAKTPDVVVLVNPTKDGAGTSLRVRDSSKDTAVVSPFEEQSHSAIEGCTENDNGDILGVVVSKAASDAAVNPPPPEVTVEAVCCHHPAGTTVTVGAFVRMLHEAPPLEGACRLSLEDGLEQLEVLRRRLASRGLAAG